MPDEIWWLIVEQAERQQWILSAVYVVCKRWQRMVMQNTLDCVDMFRPPVNDMISTRMPMLRTLRLGHNHGLTDKGIGKLSNLTSLTMRLQCRTPELTENALLTLSNLVELSFEGDYQLPYLSASRLKTLTMYHNMIANRMMSYFTALQTLDISACTIATSSINALTNLTTLRITYYPMSIESLTGLVNLTSLNTVGTVSNDIKWESFTTLKSLYLSYADEETQLTPLVRLEELVISGCLYLSVNMLTSLVSLVDLRADHLILDRSIVREDLSHLTTLRVGGDLYDINQFCVTDFYDIPHVFEYIM